MAEETMKVYTALVDFEHDKVAYKKDEKYELAGAVVEALGEGKVVEFEVPAPENTANTANTAPAGKEAGEKEEEVTEAKPWVGGHTVGRD